MRRSEVDWYDHKVHAGKSYESAGDVGNFSLVVIQDLP